MRVSFGNCVADFDAREILRAGKPVHVEPRAPLEDLGSKNGTFLKGEALTRPAALSDGDRLRIGTVEMTVRRYAGAVSTKSARRK